MKQGSIFIARGIVYLMGLAVIAVCVILLPELAREEAVANPHAGPAYPFLIGAWILSLPIFTALYQTLKLIGYIDSDTAFGERSVKALQTIRICAVVFSVLIAVAGTAVITIARMTDPTEDVTPVVTIGFIFIFSSIVVATFAAVLARLLQQAIHMKSENDLTV